MSLISTLHILPGPVYDAGEAMRIKYESLSQFSSGTVISLGPVNEENQFGKYKLCLIGANDRYDSKSNFKLLIAAVKKARTLKKTTGLDIVVCYDPLKTGLISLLIAKLYNCKVIVEVNGVYDAPALYSFKKGLLITLKKNIYPKIQRFVLFNADGVKCLFQGQVTYRRPKNPQIVKNFFDFTQIIESNYTANNQFKILSMGFPSYIKGMDLLITAFNKVSKIHPKWTLEIVGHLSESERALLNGLVENEKMVSIRKPIHFAEVPKLIDSCDIFVLASRTEAMGRVLLEAMARGRARIASNVGGIPTILNDQVDGLLFDSENADDLTKKLEALMSSEPKRKELANAGLLRFGQEFTIDCYAARIEELYNDVLVRR